MLTCLQHDGFLNVLIWLAVVMLFCVMSQKVAFNSNIRCIVDVIKGLLCISVCL